MAKLLFPADGFLFDPHTPVQREFIRRIGETGINAALRWLRTVKNSTEHTYPQELRFCWEPDGLQSSRLEISENPDFSDVFVRETSENYATVDNFKTGTTYYWRVSGSQSRTFRTAAVHPRFIRVDGALNVRDIGGIGICQGLVYRGSAIDAPFGITDMGKGIFREQLKIKTELELRTDGDPGPSPVPGVEKVTIPYRPYLEAFEPRHREHLRQIMALLSEESRYPIYIHCMGGADRTGMIALYLRALLGETDDDIHLDYELTALSTYAAGAKEGADGFRSRLSPYYTALLEGLRAYAPGHPLRVCVPEFLMQCGVTQEQLETIRNILRGKSSWR